MKLLKDIIYKCGIEEVSGSTHVPVHQVIFNSSQVTPSSLFIAVKGTATDGHKFIGDAVSRGAKSVVCEEMPAETIEGVTYVRVSNSAEALARIAANYFDNPSEQLKLIGITGTNGKTTTATLLFQLYTQLGFKCGLLSTVKNQIGNQVIPSTHTTPDPVQLNSLLSAMVEEGCEYCFMEVSSHAVVQHRIDALKFSGGIFTNITHDHLDYHKTFQEYLKAKKGFFDRLPTDSFALVNSDDKHSQYMLQHCKAKTFSYGLHSMADYRSKILESSFSGLIMNVDGQELIVQLLGTFNAYNLLSVYAAAMLLDAEKLKVLVILSGLKPVEGRFEYIKSGNVTGIVDYAHTPDALKNVLQTIENVRTGKESVITVIGCGGDRDKIKRPLMAQIAAHLSDKVILTSDNPRSEDAEAIIKDMKAGLTGKDVLKTISVTDRREAIQAASTMARDGDIILVAGKGHEKYQEIKGVKYPFDDKIILLEILQRLHQD